MLFTEIYRFTPESENESTFCQIFFVLFANSFFLKKYMIQAPPWRAKLLVFDVLYDLLFCPWHFLVNENKLLCITLYLIQSLTVKTC